MYLGVGWIKLDKPANLFVKEGTTLGSLVGSPLTGSTGKTVCSPDSPDCRPGRPVSKPGKSVGSPVGTTASHNLFLNIKKNVLKKLCKCKEFKSMKQGSLGYRNQWFSRK